MYVIISYDIVDDKKRLQVSKVLKNYGQRVQKSVFECRIDEKNYLTIKGKLERIIDMEADSIRYYSLCQRCIGGIEISGWGTVTEDEEIIIV